MNCGTCKKEIQSGETLVLGRDNVVYHTNCIEETDRKKEDIYSKYQFINKQVIDGLVYEGSEKKLDAEWLIVLSTDVNEFYGKCCRDEEEVKEILSEEQFLYEGWQFHSLYHNQKPVEVKKEVKIILQEL